MKYIMLEDTEGRKIPIIFPDHLVHEDMEQVVSFLLLKHQGRLCQTISAGFISVGTDISTFGESETLKKKSRVVDADYIIAGDAGQYMPEAMIIGLVQRIKARAAPKR